MLATSGALFLLPLLVLAFISLTDPSGPLAAYQKIFSDPFTLDVVLDTIKLGLAVVVGTTLLGVPIGLLYWHARPALRGVLVILLLLPLLTSNVVRTFAWIVILGREGVISQALLAMGLAEAPVRLLFTEPGLILAMCQIDLPLFVLPLVAVLSRVDRRLVEAAEVAGAGHWRILRTVIFPLAAPGIFAGWALVFASAMTSYVTQVSIGGARLMYLPQLIYRQVSIQFNWPYAASLSLVLLASTALFLLALVHLSRRRRSTFHA
jgi:putative spermidine/putrescine transport system permease protein